MKIHTSKPDYCCGSSSTSNSSTTIRNGVAVLSAFILMCLVVFATINYKISVHEDINTINTKCEMIKKEIAQRKKEIICLEIEQEKLSSWTHIQQKITEFKLRLRPALPGQVLTLHNKAANPDNNESGAIAMLDTKH